MSARTRKARIPTPASTASIAGRVVSLPAVRFVRHRTATAIVRMFLGGDLRNGGMEGVDAEGKTVRVGGQRIVEHVQDLGLWAWAATEESPPVIHYWHRPGVDRLHLAALLGHEVGHLSGKPLRSRRNDWREELRADGYAAATYLALKQVLGKR